MAASIIVRPITAGKLDEWREFHAELMGSRRIEWAQSQRRRGITRQVVALVEGDSSLAAIFTEGRDPEAALRALEESSDAFDVWLMERVRDLHGEPLPSEITLDTAPRPGPWKGWRT